MNNLPILKVHTKAFDCIPQKATRGSACFDIHTSINTPIVIHPAESAILPTGLKMSIPPGYVVLVFSRSGHGFKNGVRLANCVGVIDSDYRGEVMLKLVNDNPLDAFTIMPGDRIGQFMMVKLPEMEMHIVSDEKDLDQTKRGEGGFGSTGV